jgi:hypothetical protein
MECEMIRTWIAAGSVALALAVSPAKANSYDLTFIGSFFDVFAEINTDAGGDVTSITGYDIAGAGPHNSGLGLVTNPTQPNPFNNGVYIYDNVFYPSGSPYVDNGGILFTDSSGNTLNLYSVGPDSYYLSALSPGGGLYNPGDPGTLTAVASPLPSTWTMLIAGFVGVGFLAFGGKKRNVAATAAA